jgi:plasmid stability protein
MSPRVPKGPTVPVLIRKVPIAIHHKMKIIALKHGTSMEELIKGWITEAVDQLWEDNEGQTRQSR